MAIYHLSSKVIGKSKGRSAVAAAAYRSGTKIYSQSFDIDFDYSKRTGIFHSAILAPQNAPEWVYNREKLWNRVERFEKRKDAQFCREVEVSLPQELTFEQNKHLLESFIQEEFVRKGMIADYAMHDMDSHNPHAHILLTLRSIDENGFGQKVIAWNKRALFSHWREAWATQINTHLALNGHNITVDHRSYAAQGIDLEPTIHIGIQRGERGSQERFQRNLAIQHLNAERIQENPLIALALLSQQQAVFTHQDIARLANTHSISAEEFEAVRNAIQYSPEIVSLGTGIDGKDYFTTKKTLEQENNLLQTAERISQTQRHVLNPARVDFVLQGKKLQAGQYAAFRHILESGDLSLMVGFAGTGKSYLMDVLREAYESQGYRVFGSALSGRAAENLEKSSQIQSHTIARFMIDWENGRRKLDHKSVLILDEAGMVGTRQFLSILEEVERAKAKLIVVGDPEQLPPIEAGHPLRYLIEKYQHISLTEVIRQKIDWQREATVELSTQQTDKALQRYQDAGFIHEFKTKTQSQVKLISDWLKDYQEHKNHSQLVLTYSNKDVLALNQSLREALKNLRVLSRDEYKSTYLETSKFGMLEFVLNDRVLFLQNDNSLKIKNGTLGTLIDLKETSFTVKLDDDRIVTFDPKQYNHLTHGYATTIHKAQGATVDRCYVLATKRFDRFLTNVSMDRHREAVNLYYSHEDFQNYEALSQHLSQGKDKIMAVEFAESRGFNYPDVDEISQTKNTKLRAHSNTNKSIVLSKETFSLIQAYLKAQEVFEQEMTAKMNYLGEDDEKAAHHEKLADKASNLCDQLAIEISMQPEIKSAYHSLTPENYMEIQDLQAKDLKSLLQKHEELTKEVYLSIAKHFGNKSRSMQLQKQLLHAKEKGRHY